MVIEYRNAIELEADIKRANELPAIQATSTNDEVIIHTRDIRNFDISAIIPISTGANNVTVLVEAAFVDKKTPATNEWYPYISKNLNNASSIKDETIVIRPYDSGVTHYRIKINSTTAGSHGDVIIYGRYFFVQR